jgi:hypothetical protein
MRRWGWRLPAAALLAAALLLTSCTAAQIEASSPTAPGFLLGLWHGFIAPIAFIVSVFSETVRIYAFPNGGEWYDFGFMLGISGFSGGVLAGGRGKGGQKGRQKGGNR